MLFINIGEDYFEFLDYFLEQFSTGLSVVCILYGLNVWKRISIYDYALIIIALVLQFIISKDQIFYACFILPFIMCYFVLKHSLREFCFLIGVMTLICTIYISLPLAGEYWSEEQIQMLSRISAYRLSLGIYLIIFLFMCEIYLSKRRLYEAFQRMIFNDDLTGLKNRRFIREKVLTDQQFDHGYLLLLDIDDFKKVNDVYGHHIGDLVIKHLSNILRQTQVNSKVLTRWGGEEFLVVIPSGSAEECQLLCQAILDNCAETPFHTDDLVIEVAVSIGATVFEKFDVNTYENVIQKVDKSLYEAKARGKKQYVFA